MRTEAQFEEQYAVPRDSHWQKQITCRKHLRKRTILFADDNSELRELTRILLQKNGYSILTAGTGAETLRLFREKCNIVDLIIIDVFLPDSNGRQVMDNVRKINSSVKILFTSGYNKDDLENRYALKIPGHILQKPFELKQLLGEIRDILDQPVFSE